MANHEAIVTVRNLNVSFYTNDQRNNAICDVSLTARRGKTLCVVGESGCGKSVTASAIMGLLPELSRIEGGEILYHTPEQDIRIDTLPRESAQMRRLRGQDLAMIFQDPMTALNPVYTIGFQIAENLRSHQKISKAAAREQAITLLRNMDVPIPEQRVDEYPHQYSGGMRQRAMIAMAMACNPKLLIADEPTTALDVTVQAQIFELMRHLKEQYDTAILLITHDMGVVTELADDVSVMYMGYIVEEGTVEDVLRHPAHPYTRALLQSIPVLGRGRHQQLEPIRGNTPDPYDRPPGCQFAPRCDYACEQCQQLPTLERLTDTHAVRCWRHKEVQTHA